MGEGGQDPTEVVLAMPTASEAMRHHPLCSLLLYPTSEAYSGGIVVYTLEFQAVSSATSFVAVTENTVAICSISLQCFSALVPQGHFSAIALRFQAVDGATAT